MATTFDGFALELHDVRKTFGDKVAVSGLTMSARPGTVLAFLGPNGAGKSTTIEMCEGFIKPTSGSIRVLGMDPVTEPEKVRERIGIMLQGGGGYSGVKVSEMLQLAASYNEDPLDPQWLIDTLGLQGVEKTPYRRLSGGQQQRLSLALALISRPELVFLDEPTAGMDAQSRRAVWEIISALRRDGVTIVLTTHLMDEAESLADDVVIIDHGHVIAQGTPAELTDSAGEYLTIATDADADFSQLGAQRVEARRYVIHERATPELVSRIATTAAEQHVLIRSFDSGTRNLEDVFLELTGKQLRS